MLKSSPLFHSLFYCAVQALALPPRPALDSQNSHVSLPSVGILVMSPHWRHPSSSPTEEPSAWWALSPVLSFLQASLVWTSPSLFSWPSFSLWKDKGKRSFYRLQLTEFTEEHGGKVGWESQRLFFKFEGIDNWVPVILPETGRRSSSLVIPPKNWEQWPRVHTTFCMHGKLRMRQVKGF